MNRYTVVLLLSAALLSVAGCASPPEDGPTMNERFAPCPGSPNCVSSYADPSDSVHAIPPLPIVSSMDELVRVIESFPRTEIIERDGDYLHTTFTSRIFRFVDDVEFLIDRDHGVTHVRSASRVGYGDMNANRSRVEAIRERLAPGGAE